jgi:hypothetical protein
MDEQKAKAETAVQQKYGTAWPEVVDKANTTIRQFTEPGEDRDWLLELVGNSPQFADWASRVGDLLVEHKVAPGEPRTTMTKAEIQQKYAEIMSNPVYTDPLKARENPALNQALHAEATRLSELLSTQKT